MLPWAVTSDEILSTNNNPFRETNRESLQHIAPTKTDSFHCRHLPTCSEYGDEALARHGLWAGGWMTLGRICRCHPLGTSGLDFVPPVKPERARWFLPWRYARWRSTNETPPA